MSTLQSLTYGLIQGFGEFLPISSSGHLVLLPWFFGWNDPGLAFDVSLHFGTLLAVVIYFWKDILKIVVSSAGKSHLIADNQYSKNFIWLLIVGTIPAGIIGFVLEDYSETTLRKPIIIATTLVVFGALLYFVDKKKRGFLHINNLSLVDAVLIGCAQAIAIVPGVSRSGVTITAGLLRDMSREQAARFSFLLSIPVIFGAFIVKADDFIKYSGLMELFAIAVSAISGYIAIAALIKFVHQASFKAFFWYRLALALLIIISYFSK